MHVSGCIKYREHKHADGRREGKKGGEGMRALLSEAQQVYCLPTAWGWHVGCVGRGGSASAGA